MVFPLVRSTFNQCEGTLAMTLDQCARLQAAVQQLSDELNVLAGLLPELQRQRAALERAATALTAPTALLASQHAEAACTEAIARARELHR